MEKSKVLFRFLKKKNSLGVLFVFLFAASVFFVASMPNSPSVNLVQGKNVVMFNSSESFNVSDLVKLNPEIQAVSYNEGNETIGYVNAFGGIGQDFAFQKGVGYEIYSSGNITLILPS